MKAIKRIAGLAVIVGLMAIAWIIDNAEVHKRHDFGRWTLEGVIFGLLYLAVSFLVFLPLAWLLRRHRRKSSVDG